MIYQNNKLITNFLLLINIIIITAILGWVGFTLYNNFFEPLSNIKLLSKEIEQISISKLNEQEIKKSIDFEKKRQAIKLDLANFKNYFKQFGN